MLTKNRINKTTTLFLILGCHHQVSDKLDSVRWRKPKFFKIRVFHDFGVVFYLFVCSQNVKHSNLETKTCTLVWDTNPRSPSSAVLRTAEKFQFSSVPNRQSDRQQRTWISGGSQNHSLLQLTLQQTKIFLYMKQTNYFSMVNFDQNARMRQFSDPAKLPFIIVFFQTTAIRL
jgi:hypothetical protein